MRKDAPNLKDESYYSNLYDEATVERCREVMRREGMPKQVEVKGKMKRLTPKDMSVVTQIMLWGIKGERYSHKAETVREWMARDRLKDETYEGAVIPDAICPNCSAEMDCTYKHLHSEGLDEPERVLFWFRCPRCSKTRAIFDGGEEWQPKPNLCTKCQTPMKGTDKRRGKVITSTDTCPNCDHKETTTLDLTVKKTAKPKPKPDPNYEKDRKEFCLSDEEGQDYMQWIENAKKLQESMEKEEAKKANKTVYDAVAKLKKLTVSKLEELLSKAAAKQGYQKFALGEPQMGTEVTVDFSVQDGKDTREEYDSRKDLKRLIEDALFDTNWKLMSDRISYRLGVLKCRLRAIENEEDLVKMVENRKKRKR